MRINQKKMSFKNIETKIQNQYLSAQKQKVRSNEKKIMLELNRSE